MEEQAIRNIADVQSGTEKPAEQTQKPEDKLLPEHVMGPFLIREQRQSADGRRRLLPR